MWKKTKPPTDDNFFGEEERPPFPSEPRGRSPRGHATSEEFIIPKSKKQAYLNAHFPFESPPKLNERQYDIHADKIFYVRDYKLVREDCLNFIVSPYYYESGGTILDWMDPENVKPNERNA